MTVTAQLHDGRTLEFPDGTDPAVVQATVKKVLGAPKVAQPPAEPESMLETVAKAPTRFTTGLGETALAAGTGTAATAASGLLQLATFGDPEARKSINAKLNTLVYEPRTDMGKKISGAVSYPFEKLAEGADYLGGKTSELADKVLPSPVAAALGAGVNTALQAAPMLLGPAAGKLAPSAEWAARRTMQSALKPTRGAIDSGKAGQAITTLLDEGVNATEGGARTLRDKVNSLNSDVESLLAPYKDAPVDKQRVIDAFVDSYGKALKQGTPQADLKILQDSLNEFLQHPLANGTQTLPVELAQQIKQGVWRKLGEKSFGKGLVPDASRDSQKAIGTGLRQGIEDVVPDVGPVNAQTGEFLNALKQVERRTGIEGNKNLLGLGVLSPSIENALIWLLDRSPAGKSELAHMLHSTAQGLPAGGAAAGPLAVIEEAKANQRKQRLQDLQR